jgi:hypothetical protein
VSLVNSKRAGSRKQNWALKYDADFIVSYHRKATEIVLSQPRLVIASGTVWPSQLHDDHPQRDRGRFAIGSHAHDSVIRNEQEDGMPGRNEQRKPGTTQRA